MSLRSRQHCADLETKMNEIDLELEIDNTIILIQLIGLMYTDPNYEEGCTIGIEPTDYAEDSSTGENY